MEYDYPLLEGKQQIIFYLKTNKVTTYRVLH